MREMPSDEFRVLDKMPTVLLERPDWPAIRAAMSLADPLVTLPPGLSSTPSS